MNNKGFQVGEVCIFQNCTSAPELNGTELTITGPLHEFVHAISGDLVSGYSTDLTYKGMLIAPRPDQLRRKQPPADTSAWFADKMLGLQIYRPELAGEPA